VSRLRRREEPGATPPPLSTQGDRVRLVVEPGEDGMRLDRFLAARMPWRSRTRIEALIQDGEVELAGRSPRPARKVREGEAVLIRLPQPKRDRDLDATGGTIDLPVLFEDRHLLAVDKPPNVPVHPGGRLLYRTVITELHERYRVHGDPERDIVPKLCHRLDLETSGVLLVGKSDRIVAEVGRQLRERETIKEYLAIVHGRVEPDEQEVDEPIGAAVGSRVQMRRAVRADGTPARTGVRVEARYEGFTLVRLRLYTGRRHQLRVHLRHLGHPIVGDKLYGRMEEEAFLAYYEERLDDRMREELLLERQALHAARIVLRHPVEDRWLEVVSALPADLRRFLDRLAPEHPEPR